MPQPPPIDAVSQSSEEKPKTEVRPEIDRVVQLGSSAARVRYTTGGLPGREDLREHVSVPLEEGQLEAGGRDGGPGAPPSRVGWLPDML